MNEMRKLMEASAQLFDDTVHTTAVSANSVLDAVDAALTEAAGDSWEYTRVERLDEDAMEFTVVVTNLAPEDDEDAE